MTLADSSAIAFGRLAGEEYVRNFDDLHPPLSHHEALVEANRCYFCFDAPCMEACPTSIDIPMFIRQITTENPRGSARTIFAENILGGMCARVCPTETLCEEVCVREDAEGKPVKIGQLQRYSTDHLMDLGEQPFSRGQSSGKKVAIVGGGPAGLSCAHRLAMYGHEVTVFDRRAKAGGLSEYGIAAYKAADNFAARELQFVLEIGGISVETDKALGKELSLADLNNEFDAVFLSLGLANVNALGLEGEDAPGCMDAVDYIADLRQAEDLSSLPVGRNIVVIGGGMTAIDVAIQTKLLGAKEVIIAYRRGAEEMGASLYEQELAQTHGVTIRHWLQPNALKLNASGEIAGIELEATAYKDGRLTGTGEMVTLAADMVFKAIGQKFNADPLADSGVEMESRRIKVDADRQTSVAGVWAGGDCVAGGEDLTVVAVEDGKVAAMSIHRTLSLKGGDK